MFNGNAMAKSTGVCSVIGYFCVAVAVAVLCLSPSVNAHCYEGSVTSNGNNKIPISSLSELHLKDCGKQPSPITVAPTPTEAITTEAITTEATTTEATTTNATTTEATTTNATTTEATTTNATTIVHTTTPTTRPPSGPGRRRRAVTDAPVLKSCAWFRYFHDSKLTINSTWTVNFTCVANCTTSSNTTINGTVGSLTCCNTGKCNSLEAFMSREKVQFEMVQQCASGSINGSDNSVNSSTTCLSDDSFYCTNSTDPDNGVVTYGCSGKTEDNVCMNANITRQGCHTDSTDNTTICCCTWDNCNYRQGIPTAPSPTGTTPITPVPTSHALSTGTIVGLVFMGFFIGIIVGICVTCYCINRKKGAQSIDFNYSRITADSTEDAGY